MLNNHQPITGSEGSYEVRVGFTRVRVSGSTREEAIANARRQLCLEMPRMWDLISSMSEQRFDVESIDD